MTGVDARLAALRGAAAERPHTARTIAALTTNPGCDRRAVLDAAGIDKEVLAATVGHPARFGQSPFAIARGNGFEAQVKADGCAALLELLRELLRLPIGAAAYEDLSPPDPPSGDDADTRESRHERARALITAAASGRDGSGTLFDHPLLRLAVGGRSVYLEPDLIAFQLGGRFHVVEVKSFAVIDGQADGAKVAAAARQSAVYVLALRQLLAAHGLPAETVSPEVVLVCPRDFANRPTASLIDVRPQLSVLERQLTRMARIDTLLDRLPAGLSFDVSTVDGVRLADALHQVDARYAPECLSTCELSFFCRTEARGNTAALGRSVREALGGVETVVTALGLAAGTVEPTAEQAEAAATLRHAARLRAEILAGAPSRP